MLLHATTIAVNQQAVVITGAPGAGKSDLALRMIDAGAVLVSDDQTELSVIDDVLVASPPISIAGMIELRHVGLITMPYIKQVPVALTIDLVGSDYPLERLPDLDLVLWLDHPVRRIRLPSYAASTPCKIRAVLQHGIDNRDE